MKTRYFLFLLLFLVTFGACSDPKHVTEPLYRAEALMNEAPDSAWAVLNTVSPDEMGQNRTRALYALLYTQAQDKTYRDETNDSLISVAVDYYRHTDDVRHKFLSYYYKGRVSFNAKDYLNATSCYMEAEQLADAVAMIISLACFMQKWGVFIVCIMIIPRVWRLIKKRLNVTSGRERFVIGIICGIIRVVFIVIWINILTANGYFG